MKLIAQFRYVELPLPVHCLPASPVPAVAVATLAILTPPGVHSRSPYAGIHRPEGVNLPRGGAATCGCLRRVRVAARYAIELTYWRSAERRARHTMLRDAACAHSTMTFTFFAPAKSTGQDPRAGSSPGVLVPYVSSIPTYSACSVVS